MAHKLLAAGWLLSTLLILSACAESTRPEDQVRAFIDELETLVEEREYLELVDRISSDYGDSRGNDKLKVAGILRGYFLRNKNINLFIRIDHIALPGRDFAQVSFDVFMAGRAMTENDVFSMPKSDFEHFDLELVREGENWLVARAEWTASRQNRGF